VLLELVDGTPALELVDCTAEDERVEETPLLELVDPMAEEELVGPTVKEEEEDGT
jgi:hypothetical protein